MKVLAKIFCLAMLFLSIGDSWVIKSFKDHCDEFFYNKFQPEGLVKTNSEIAKICQCYQGRRSFATLYNKSNRIALYSAYIYVGESELEPKITKLCGPEKQDPAHRCGTKEGWCVEPGLAGFENDGRKSMENGPRENDDDFVKFHQSQALDQDYTEQTTKYTRSHLNPKGHHKNFEFESSTFTLTNTVPQIQSLNQKWAVDYEETIKSLFINCSKMYILTGAVPSAENFMKSDKNKNDEYGKVNIPDVVWSAYCCVDNNERPVKSGGHWLDNTEGSTVRKPSLGHLQRRLSEAFGKNVRLFSNDCEK